MALLQLWKILHSHIYIPGLCKGRTLQISSAFSGTLSAELAAEQIVEVLNASLEEPMQTKAVSAVEKNMQMVEEMMWLDPHRTPAHIFMDIMSCLPTELQELLNSSALSAADMKSRILKSKIRQKAWCARHQRLCPYIPGHIHVAGVPCVNCLIVSCLQVSRWIPGDSPV